FVIALALGITPLFGCNPSEVSETPTESTAPEASQTSNLEATESQLEVMVSIPPQKYFVERIGGDRVNVSILLPPGASPATYEPKPQQLQSLSDADAYVRIHVPFENAWWERISSANSDLQVIDLTEDIDRMPMAFDHHHHGEEGEHGHDEAHGHNEAEAETGTNPDPHIWLSPPLVKEQAQTIYNALVELDPQNQPKYQENLAAFIAEIEQLNQDIEATLANVEDRTFMVFHPAWGYFADAYNLEMIPIEVGGNEPSAAEMSQLIKEAEAENIEVIFAQPQFSTRSAKTIASEIGGEVILIDPLAEDWMSNMRKVADTFEQVLS
ncbi:metal ABC transporter solute-binding protein, Zn/Mn family, partial [Oscillatoria salina]|uniref:metal ABC transporter solute-binding protein, Zn/Mn family n=1 Tax=Oscillatoria salina TaxID=331517 RepID=UPI001CCF6865